MSHTNGEKLAPSITVNSLTYAFPDGSSGLRDVSLDLPAGSRALLIGGKTFKIKHAQSSAKSTAQQMAPAKQPSYACSLASVWHPAALSP